MLTEHDFRRIVLGMKDTVESAHMGHPDFRLNGRMFATLHADRQGGMVVLTPEEQERSVRDFPRTFVPEKGAWGAQGCTAVRLDSVEEEVLGEALTLAWQHAERRQATRRQTKRSSGRASRHARR